MKKKLLNRMSIEVESLSVNESFCRGAVTSFISQLDPTLDEISDIRTAVSEAVTNCVVHAYRETTGTIYISVKYYDDRGVRITVKDKGCGIDNIPRAMEPLYTTDPNGERGGMGFAIMDNFCDKLSVSSKIGAGTTVTMVKQLQSKVKR